MTTMQVYAPSVFNMLRAHAAQYATRIETREVIRDIKHTFGVELSAPAVTHKLRWAVKRGLLVRIGTKREGYWMFSTPAASPATQPAAHPAAADTGHTPRPVTRAETVAQGAAAGRLRGVKGRERLDIEAFIRKWKHPGVELVFSAEGVSKSTPRRVPKRKLRKALQNMAARGYLTRGPRRGRLATYIVDRDDLLFLATPAPTPSVVEKTEPARPDAVRSQETTESRMNKVRDKLAALYAETDELTARYAEMLIRTADVLMTIARSIKE